VAVHSDDPVEHPALALLARSPRLLVCCDFDGTLAPIVADPAAARPLPAGVAALRALADLPRTAVALISGRALADLAALSGLTAPIRLVGSHGAEFADGALPGLDGPARELLAEMVRWLRESVAAVPGVALEVKPASVAVHVRRAARPDADRVLTQVRAGPARLPGVQPTEGHEVLELSVITADKGAAIDQLRRESSATATLFLGDDVTDERGFGSLRDGDLGVKVGPGPTAAGLRVNAPTDVAALLARLAIERARWLTLASRHDPH
jgi:trehalose-phosphatase